MKLQNLRIGDKIKFLYYGQTKVGYICSFSDYMVGISEGNNIGRAQMWVVHSDNILAKINVVETLDEIERPMIPVVIPFKVDSLEIKQGVSSFAYSYSFNGPPETTIRASTPEGRPVHIQLPTGIVLNVDTIYSITIA